MKRWLFLMLLMPLATQANTFVGNGGGAGDVELSVTRKQIEEAFKAVQKHSGDVDGDDFCRCSYPYSNRSVCDYVKSLVEKEKKYCSEVMKKQAPEMIRMASKDNAVSYRWTNEAISVADRGEVRAVDAVTNREKREITINLNRFLELKPFERVFLLTHELMHLTTIDGKPVGDESAVGPFEGDQGGRRLLNAIGSSAAMLQGEYPSEIRKYNARLSRSKSWKPFWVDLNFGQAAWLTKSKNTFASASFNRSQITGRYALGNFVLVAAYGLESNEKKVLGAINVKEDVSIASLGLGYRIFPFGDPETFWGQSHFLIQVTADWVTGKVNLSQTIQDNYKISTFGGTASLHYYLPLFWGFWGYAGASLEMHPYDYRTPDQNINLKYDGNVFSQYLGVAYAF